MELNPTPLLKILGAFFFFFLKQIDVFCRRLVTPAAGSPLHFFAFPAALFLVLSTFQNTLGPVSYL